MPTAPTFIQAESVSREYRLGETVIRAVDGVSLNVEKGEFLALLGSSLGFALALWSVPALVRHLPADLPRISEISVDRRVLAFTALLTVATGILFGMVPLLQSQGISS